jgi:hypothetical protein
MLQPTQKISLKESKDLSEKNVRIINKINKHFLLMNFSSALNDPEEKRKVFLQGNGTEEQELGFCECNRSTESCTIGISPSIENESDLFVEAVILHEIGHAFGLRHSKDRNSLMYENLSRKKKFNINDIYRFIKTLKEIKP